MAIGWGRQDGGRVERQRHSAARMVVDDNGRSHRLHLRWIPQQFVEFDGLKLLSNSLPSHEDSDGPGRSEDPIRHPVFRGRTIETNGVNCAWSCCRAKAMGIYTKLEVRAYDRVSMK